jgi:methylmalonyl-CoA carboxyltransferase 5S subunit
MGKKIEITDVILRDAHQSLMATRMALEDMIPALEDLDATGYWSLECWGGATFDSCIRFLNEDPWERLRTFKKHLPNTQTQMLLRGQNLLGYRHYGDEVVERFVDKAATNGMDVFRIFDAVNDPRNFKTAVEAVKKTGKHAQGTISYTISPMHDANAFVEMAQKLKDMDVDSICIKDMAALLRPQPAYDIVKGIKEKCGEDTKVHVHVHATTGVTLVSLMKAIEAGADMVDGSLSAMSLGPGHNPTEAIVEMLKGTGYETGLDMERVKSANGYFKDIKRRYKKFWTKFEGVEPAIFESQIPGGMLSNMEGQLEQQGMGEKLTEVLDEVPKVRKDSGFPPLVTPTSQIVGTQAVFNVMFGRYKNMTGEFTDLVLGYYGETIADKDPEVVKLAQDKTGKEPITERPADLIKPEWEELKKEASALEGFNNTDEDVLTHALFPKVAPKFFKERSEGPRNLGEEPTAQPPEAPDQARTGTAPKPDPAGAPSVSGPVNLKVTIGNKSRDVRIEPM